jgi:hypothetical protein
MYSSILLSRITPRKHSGNATNIDRGRADVKYQCTGNTPHSELRFKTELNQKTSISGHVILFHIIESIKIVAPMLKRAVVAQHLIALHNVTCLVSRKCKPIGHISNTISHLNTAIEKTRHLNVANGSPFIQKAYAKFTTARAKIFGSGLEQ